MAGNQIFNDPSAAVNAGTYAGQARPDKQDVDIWTAASNRVGVISGCAVTQHAGSANMTVDVAAGVVLIGGVAVTVPALSGLTIAAQGGTDRIDVVSVDASGIPVVTTGAGGSSPVWPNVAGLAAQTSVALAIVYVPATGGVGALRASLHDLTSVITVSGAASSWAWRSAWV